MIIAHATLKSLSPYSQSRMHGEPKLDGELDDAHERRTWRAHLHVVDGHVVIPPMAIKSCIDDAAKRLSLKIPGAGKKTWTAVLTSGIFIAEPMMLDISPEEVTQEWISASPRGQVGPGPRVQRCYPTIPQWEGSVAISIFNPMITREVLLQHLEYAGRYIGVGRFRPSCRGYYGRFQVLDLTWEVEA